MGTLERRLTEAYRAYHFLSSPNKMVARRMIREFGFRCGRCPRVLEVGGGNAMMRSVIQSAWEPQQFVSSDIDPSEGTDVVCDAQELPFADGVFDAVVAFEVMEHIPDTRRLLSEIGRVSKCGGYLLLSMPFVYGEHDYRDFYRWTRQGLSKVLVEHNFRLVSLNGCGGTFLSAVTLVTNYIYRQFRSRPSSWRSRASYDRAALVFLMIVTCPLMCLSWIAYFVDMLIDRKSVNPCGFVLVSQKVCNAGNENCPSS